MPAAALRGRGTCPDSTSSWGSWLSSRHTGCTRTGRPAWLGCPLTGRSPSSQSWGRCCSRNAAKQAPQAHKVTQGSSATCVYVALTSTRTDHTFRIALLEYFDCAIHVGIEVGKATATQSGQSTQWSVVQASGCKRAAGGRCMKKLRVVLVCMPSLKVHERRPRLCMP